MQSVSSRIWTRVSVSNSYDNNHYTTGTLPYTSNNLIQFTKITEQIVLIGQWVECSQMALETGVQSQGKSYQRLKKMVLDTSLLNTQHYKVRFKGKVEQSKERSCALPYKLGIVAIETTVGQQWILLNFFSGH